MPALLNVALPQCAQRAAKPGSAGQLTRGRLASRALAFFRRVEVFDVVAVELLGVRGRGWRNEKPDNDQRPTRSADAQNSPRRPVRQPVRGAKARRVLHVWGPGGGATQSASDGQKVWSRSKHRSTDLVVVVVGGGGGGGGGGGCKDKGKVGGAWGVHSLGVERTSSSSTATFGVAWAQAAWPRSSATSSTMLSTLRKSARSWRAPRCLLGCKQPAASRPAPRDVMATDSHTRAFANLPFKSGLEWRGRWHAYAPGGRTPGP